MRLRSEKGGELESGGEDNRETDAWARPGPEGEIEKIRRKEGKPKRKVRNGRNKEKIQAATGERGSYLQREYVISRVIHYRKDIPKPSGKKDQTRSAARKRISIRGTGAQTQRRDSTIAAKSRGV